MMKLAAARNVCRMIVINKMDLAPFLELDLEKCKEMARRVSPGIAIFEVSARTGEGMADWYEWLARNVNG